MMQRSCVLFVWVFWGLLFPLRCLAGSGSSLEKDDRKIGLRVVVQVAQPWGAVLKLLADVQDDSAQNTVFLRRLFRRDGDWFFEQPMVPYSPGNRVRFDEIHDLRPGLPNVELGLWSRHRWVILRTHHPIWREYVRARYGIEEYRRLERRRRAQKPKVYSQWERHFDAIIAALEKKCGKHFSFGQE